MKASTTGGSSGQAGLGEGPRPVLPYLSPLLPSQDQQRPAHVGARGSASHPRPRHPAPRRPGLLRFLARQLQDVQVSLQAGYAGALAGLAAGPQVWAGLGQPCQVALPPATLILPDSDSDDEDTHFFSVGASGAHQASAPEPPRRHSQSTFSTLVTVLKGRITALCEAKVRAGLGRRPLAPEPPDRRATQRGSSKAPQAPTRPPSSLRPSATY